MATTTVKRPRKSLEEQLDAVLAKAQKLQKRKAEQEKRDVERLRTRLGVAAIAAGFSEEWTNAQLERAFASAVKLREVAARTGATPPANKPTQSSPQSPTSTVNP